MAINPTLFGLAQDKVWKTEKRGFQPPGGGGDPAAMAGAHPGGAPAPGGAPPPGGAPMPGAPSAPGMDPMAGGMPGAMPGIPQATPQGAAGGAGAKPKFDPLMLDYRMYNLQQQMSAIMNALGVQVPPGALVMPPGTMGAPPAEAAMPGGPMDPASQQGGGGGQQGSAISPIAPMQGASPEMAQMGKQGSAEVTFERPAEVEAFLKDASAHCPAGWRIVVLKSAAEEPVEPPVQSVLPPEPVKTSAEKFAEAIAAEPVKPVSFVGDPVESAFSRSSQHQGAAAVAALLRSRAAGV